jgi:spore germination protein YaaH
LYDRAAMVGRNPARFLAPAALVAVAVGAFLVVSNNVNSSSNSTPASHVLDLNHLGRNKYAHRRFYTVQPGDNLTSISTKTGISMPRLEQLNSSLDPNSLQTGQRLRLRQ